MKPAYPTEQEKDRALEVVNVLFLNGFHDALRYTRDMEITQYEYYRPNLDRWITEHSDFLKNWGINIFNGETKVCIIDSSNPNWVIKIGFDRSTNPDYVSRGVNCDFCAKESDFFSKACDNNLDWAFAATYCLREIDGVFVAIQEAVKIDDDLFMTIFEDYISSSDNNSSNDAEDLENYQRVEAVFPEGANSLIKFIEDHDINDLHSGNWGIRANGDYVIMDFSGYIG